jgi:drug/metabolite transporter (DMT)-like permease
MLELFFFVLIFSLAGTMTTVLLGDRNLLSGNLLTFHNLFALLIHWKFILAMLCAFVARYSFMLINSQLLKNPALAPNSTTVTALITSVSFLFLLAGNAIFLGERLNMQQGLGGTLIIIGTWVILK